MSVHILVEGKRHCATSQAEIYQGGMTSKQTTAPAGGAV